MSKKRNFFESLQEKYASFEANIDRKIFENDRVKRLMPWIRPLLIVCIVIPAISVLVPLSHLVCMGSDAAYMENFAIVLTFAELFFGFAILHSFILTFAIYNRLERRAFLEKNKTDFDQKAVRREILHSRETWIEIAVLQVFFLIHPVEWGFFAIFQWIPTADTWHPLLRELFWVPILFLLTLWFEVRARIAARRVWVEAPSQLQQKRIWQSMAIKKRRHYDLWHMLRRILLHCLVYTVSTLWMPFLMMTVFNLFSISLTLLFTPWIWIALAAWGIWMFLRAFWSRFRFLSKLKAQCKREGYELFALKGAYRALLLDSSSYTFGVKAHGKTYYCRLLSSVKRSNNIHIRADGTLDRVFALRVPRLLHLNMYGARGFSDEANQERTLEFFNHVSVSDYTFEADGIKVVILNPVARRVYVESTNGKLAPIDNGDLVGDYKFFTGNAFLRALERDCADK